MLPAVLPKDFNCSYIPHRSFYSVLKFLFHCFLFITATVHNTFALDIQSDQTPLNLSPHFYWYQDFKNEVTIDELLQNQYIDEFYPPTHAHTDTDIRSGVIWLYAEINNNDPATDTESMWFLDIDSPFTRSVDLYIVNEEDVTHYTQPTNPAAKSVPSHMVGPIDIAVGSTTIFLRIESTRAIKVPVALHSNDSAVEHIVSSNIWSGLEYGVVLAIGLYGFFLFLAFGSKGYLFFVAYLLCLLTVIANSEMNSFAKFIPEFLLGPDYQIFFSCLYFLFGLLFASYFLRIKSNLPKIIPITRFLSVALLVTAFASFVLSNITATLLAYTLFICVSITTIYITSVQILSGDKTARYFLISWLTLYAGMTVTVATFRGLLPYTELTSNSDNIAIILHVILLSFALADRYNKSILSNEHKLRLSQEQLSTANQELNNALNQVEKNNILKDQFLATISHELRTPMNGVEGSLGLIKTGNMSNSQRNYIDSARQSAREMTSMIDSILRFSEIQSGELNIKSENFEIRESFNPVFMEFRQKCLAKGLDFSFTVDKHVPAVIRGDKEHILLVVKQLVDNAIKFTHQGKVQINIGSQVNESTGKKQLSITVIDTGEGIPNDKLETIFNAFQQLDSSNNRSFQGLGIGLAICKQLVDYMHGYIDIQSSANKGTSITLYLPLKQSSHDVPAHIPSHTTDDESLSTMPVSPKTILIAEDNPVNQMVLKGMLQDMDCILLTVNNGQEALQLLEDQPIDLIMMDCQMPIIDGFQATETIRSSGAVYCNVPIIAVTANAMTMDSQRCMDAGMNDYIKKPINRDILLTKVTRWLQHGKLTAV